MQVIAIGGEPGSGKTTLMKRLVEHFKAQPIYNEVKLVPYLRSGNVYILGKYEDDQVFAGTDRMSMAVQPEAIKFLKTLPDNSIVLYEGDRLFTASFLEHCANHHILSIIYLSTDRDTRRARYEERGSNQDATWLQGRESKIANILGNLVLMWHTEKFDNNDLEEQEKVFNHIVKMVD